MVAEVLATGLDGRRVQARTDALRAEIATRTDGLRADLGADLREIRDAIRSLDRRLTSAGG
ncbi:MAG: hypothetical protein ACRDTP_00155 [Mycobacteriales bacterium]